MTQKIWFITGVSTGFGRAIANAAIAAGDTVVGTLRNEEQRKAFDNVAPGRTHGVILDVTDNAKIHPTVDRVEREIGPIDVLVNNAGYGHEGTFEESSLEDLRRQFDVNVFGAVAVTQAVLPHMRQRRAGRIINITSMGGLITLPSLSFYHGSKFALEGLSEALGKEVKGFGIFVTAVEPGSFRTDWAGRSMNRAPRRIADYDALIDPLREKRLAMSGKQLGDPAKLGEAVVKIANAENPPAHLLLGSDARTLVDRKLSDLRAEYDAWNDLTLSTDFNDKASAGNSWA
ncbi:MAG: oxidoreductase [Pseudomonas sp. PGPPP3]|jgi:NAD(P)-dependent dehydrogenase (short-subunit alcohol dehydrogenase family)|uniref:Oxidoreductase n=2 Tax=Nitrobacteraceae TaxID=41294 RepID=A0A7C9VDM8_9BRAD|nr:oxidoreductase [Bradyrhizobium denitrificans]MBR1139188.1 oxidoreductase [Bradyrhizobium denitrificans]NGX95628.1 oxidoreductase [Candidatus Afipia apatlaquensis]OYT96517.1 MAG: oxidoreductase [Pseudomonas sp. PGPPP3]RTM12577.1 MAG: oxidoreductase [Bradyrhizobiaceae bacterium]